MAWGCFLPLWLDSENLRTSDLEPLDMHDGVSGLELLSALIHGQPAVSGWFHTIVLVAQGHAPSPHVQNLSKVPTYRA